MLMLNSTEIKKLGYTQTEANAITQRLCASCPTKTITMMIQYEHRGQYREALKAVRHVKLSDAMKLCDERVKNVCNIKSVDVEFWGELKNKLMLI